MVFYYINLGNLRSCTSLSQTGGARVQAEHVNLNSPYVQEAHSEHKSCIHRTVVEGARREKLGIYDDVNVNLRHANLIYHLGQSTDTSVLTVADKKHY